DDNDLVVAAKAGNQEAFGQLVLRYDRRVFAAALHICNDVEEAKDAVQSAWLKAFRSIRGFRQECPFVNWVLRIVVREGLGRAQRRRRDQALLDSADHWFTDDFEPRPLPDSSRRPDRLLSQREVGEILKQEIARLPQTYSTVFLMRELEEFSTAEVAQTLGISISLAKVRLFRARAKLRKALAKYLATWQPPVAPRVTPEFGD